VTTPALDLASDIHVRGLRKIYRQKGSGTAVVAIDRLDFSVRRGEIIAIVGKTGCGKSTFFNILIGLEPPTDGRIDIGGLTPYGDFDRFRGHIGIIFQQDRLLPWRSLVDNVTLGLEIGALGPAERARGPSGGCTGWGSRASCAVPQRAVRRHAPRAALAQPSR
jgi:ABC-type nitrate/sulfonate/bicarbonate transport system ATPase subunit